MMRSKYQSAKSQEYLLLVWELCHEPEIGRTALPCGWNLWTLALFYPRWCAIHLTPCVGSHSPDEKEGNNHINCTPGLNLSRWVKVSAARCPIIRCHHPPHPGCWCSPVTSSPVLQVVALPVHPAGSIMIPAVDAVVAFANFIWGPRQLGSLCESESEILLFFDLPGQRLHCLGGCPDV